MCYQSPFEWYLTLHRIEISYEGIQDLMWVDIPHIRNYIDDEEYENSYYFDD